MWVGADYILDEGQCPVCRQDSCEDPLHVAPADESPARLQRESGQAVYAAQLADAVHRERARREARRLIDVEERSPTPSLEIVTLRDRLARPVPPVTHRIEDWQPAHTRVLLAAQFKAGKTTLVGNHIRALVDGDPWLGRHHVTPMTGTVVLLDFEMDGHQLDRWLRDQQIMNDDRVIPISLRGQVSAFDILDTETRAVWVERLRTLEADYLVVDCLRPILDVLGLDEHHDAGRFLVALDALLYEAGIADCLVVHHMGHTNERSRGDSRLRDWPDVEWRLVRQNDDPASPRFLTAYGRDVDMDERQLDYNAATRRLTIAGGSRQDTAKEAALAVVVAVLDEADEALSQRGLLQRVRADTGALPRDRIRAAILHGVATGQIHAEAGPGKAVLHSSVTR